MTGKIKLEKNNKNKLLFLSILFVAIIATALVTLVQYTFSQLQWESFHQNRIQAEALGLRIDQELQTIFDQEEQRSINDYQFFISSDKDNSKASLQRSILSQLPLPSNVPGIIGYFQIDANNRFSTPIFPDDRKLDGVVDKLTKDIQYNLSPADYSSRLQQYNQLVTLLKDNELAIRSNGEGIVEEDTTTIAPSAMASVPAPIVESSDLSTSSGAFDRLQIQEKISSKNKLGRLDDLVIDQKNREFDERSRALKEEKFAVYEKRLKERELSQKQLRKEQRVQFDTEAASEAQARVVSSPSAVDVKIFEKEMEPFRVNILASGHLVVFRRVWTGSERLLQGMLIDREQFIDTIIQDEFLNSALAQKTRLAVAYQGDILTAYGNIAGDGYGYLDSARQLSGTLLYQKTLLSPFDDFNIVFTIEDLSSGSSGQVVTFSALVLFLTVLVGTFLFNRYASAQYALMLQQQDFISSVSHELKTPLTSIRMYGEMLKEGWVSDVKKNEYYQFIFDESERLTRLINNVLQLAKLTHNTLIPEIECHSVGKLVSILESKLSGQIAGADFTLGIKTLPESNAINLEIDLDMFIQIMINIVDNAIKYSAKSTTKKIDIEFLVVNKKLLNIGVRDYGPGIDPKQLDKIFSLFYRTENELTRETKGTGIGLALVNQYVHMMGGKVFAKNKQPGLEVVIEFSIV